MIVPSKDGDSSPADLVHLVDPGFPRYADPRVTTAHQDVLLLSRDGFSFGVNSVILVASCSFSPALLSPETLGAIGGSDSSQDAVAISTEIDAEELQVVVDFVTLGRIPEQAVQNTNLREGFQCFGIDFGTLKLFKSRQDVTSDVDGIKRRPIEMPKCETRPKRGRKRPIKSQLQAQVGKPKDFIKEEEEEDFFGDEHNLDEEQEFAENEDLLLDVSSSPKKKRIQYRSKPPGSSCHDDPGFITEGERDTSLKFQCPDCLYGTNSSRYISQHKRR